MTRDEINDQKTVNSIEKQKKIKETKNWFCEKINIIDKCIAKMTKEKRKKMQITNIKNERGDHITLIPK